MLNLHRDKIRRREPGRDGKVSGGRKQNGNVAVGRIGKPITLRPIDRKNIHTRSKTKVHTPVVLV